ncbi:hypothetical protein CA3LBN_003564 [Candidozyma haemuli]|uniref:Uncharacterized protein n=1 Tax=Candidozyma haemuli TaxID=45357 RepID=A0ABX8I7J8_9ASCO|nr:hypothetical protein CA3LBN_003564 [[Candida] haemuloni]
MTETQQSMKVAPRYSSTRSTSSNLIIDTEEKAKEIKEKCLFVFVESYHRLAEQVTCVLVAHLEQLNATIKVAEPGEKDIGGHLSRYKPKSSFNARYQDIWQGEKVSQLVG